MSNVHQRKKNIQICLGAQICLTVYQMDPKPFLIIQFVPTQHCKVKKNYEKINFITILDVLLFQIQTINWF